MRIVGLGQRIDLEVVPHALDARLGLAVDEERAEDRPHAIGRGAHDDVALRHLARVAGRQDQVFAARTLVGAGDADIDHPLVPEVVDRPEHLGGNLDHHRALLGVDPDEAVDRVVIGRQFDRPRIDEVFPDHVGAVDRAELQQRVAHARLVHDRNRQQIGLQRPRAVEVVPDLLLGLGCRETVLAASGCRSRSPACRVSPRRARWAWSSCRFRPGLARPAPRSWRPEADARQVADVLFMLSTPCSTLRGTLVDFGTNPVAI